MEHLLHRATTFALLTILLAACAGTPTPGALPAAGSSPAPTLPATAGAGLSAAPTAPAPTSPAPPAAAAITPGSGDGQINLGALYHMSRDPLYRSPGGAVPAGTAVTLRLKAAAGDLTGASVRVWDSRAAAETLVPMALERREGDADYWQVTLPTPATPDVLWYRFLVHDGAAGAAYQDDPARDGGNGVAQAAANDNDYSINCYDPHWTVPAWMRDAVIYQIFPDRFNNGDPGNDEPAGQPVYDSTTERRAWTDPPRGNNEFYGGDLQGVINKLDYLQSLGVTVLYFNPIFDAASNHGYDTRDYTKIAPWLGSPATWDALVAETRKRNMHIILDGVFNHTSSDSPYFDRYGHYPTLGAFESQTSPYFAWYHFAQWPQSYNTYGNYDTLPQLQEVDPVRDFLFRRPDSVAQRWLGASAAGWRLDAADLKSDAFWRDFRRSVRAAYPDAVIIGEYWQNATGWLSGDEWDGVMDYRFRDAALGFFSPGSRAPVDDLDNRLASIREDYPPAAVQTSMNLVDSHDTERALTLMGGDKNRLRLLALLQFTSPGAPTVYYGDEAGLAGGKDPDDRRTYPWGSEDPSLIAFYRALGQARHAVPALATGRVQTLLIHNDRRLYAYARQAPGSTAIAAFNLGTDPQTLDLDVHGLLPDGTVLHDLLSNDTAYSVQSGRLQVPVAADWGALLR